MKYSEYMRELRQFLFKIRHNQLIYASINTMGLRILGIITLFGFTLYLTHNYEAKLIGQLDFIRTYLLIVGSLCIVGTDQSILYFAGILNGKQSIGNLKGVYKKMLLLIFIMCILVSLALVLIGKSIIDAFFHDDTTYQNILKATLILFFYSVTIFNTEVFRALDSIYTAELFRNTFKYFSVIIGAVVLLNIEKKKYLIDTFLYGFVILSIVSSILIFKLFKKQNLSNLSCEYSYSTILNKSYPMGISAIAIFLLMSIDIIFIKKHLGDEKVAYYAIAVKLMSILLMIMNSVTISISTKISEYFTSGNIILLKLTMKNSARIIFGLSIPIILLVCIFSNSILSFFGNEFLQSKEPLFILIIGQGLCSMFGGVQVYLNMTGRQNIFKRIVLIAVFFNLLLNSFLIPKYGMNGGAIAYVLSMFFWNFIATLIIYKKDNINVFLS